ncbi:caspase family protein [Azospirillum sp. HJ39]|uniref:caspase family protein n=1 Tax=Azospirillum sp. HJ39 TaxID=3159496 RepID=UPI003557531D
MSSAVPTVKPLVWDGRLHGEAKLYALVIGVGDYANLPEKSRELPNSKVDARAMAKTLKTYGYQLIGGGPLINPKAREIRRWLQEVRRLGKGADRVLIYLSGHGIQKDYTNLYLPADAELSQTATMISVNEIIASVEGNKAGSVLIFDMCRDTRGELPAERMTYARLPEPPERTMIGFSARPGTKSWGALQGGGSYYTTELIKQIEADPFDNVERIFHRTSQNVVAQSRTDGDVARVQGVQEPVFSGGMGSLGALQLVPGRFGTVNERAIVQRPPYCNQIHVSYRDICYLAMNGYASFQFSLGEMFHFGDLAPVNEAESHRWQELAAHQGNFAALLQMGMDNLNKDYAKVVRYLTPVADAGFPMAAFVLSNAHTFGEHGVSENDTLSVKYLRLAADQGYTLALSMLAKRYYLGEGVPRDLAVALDLASDGASRGDADALSMLGRMYYEDKGIPKDDALARRYFTKAFAIMIDHSSTGAVGRRTMTMEIWRTISEPFRVLAIMMERGIGGPVDHNGAERVRTTINGWRP